MGEWDALCLHLPLVFEVDHCVSLVSLDVYFHGRACEPGGEWVPGVTDALL